MRFFISNGGGLLPTNRAFKQCARAHASRYSTHALMKLGIMLILIMKFPAQTLDGWILSTNSQSCGSMWYTNSLWHELTSPSPGEPQPWHYRQDFDERLEVGLEVSELLGCDEAASRANGLVEGKIDRKILVLVPNLWLSCRFFPEKNAQRKPWDSGIWSFSKMLIKNGMVEWSSLIIGWSFTGIQNARWSQWDWNGKG